MKRWDSVDSVKWAATAEQDLAELKTRKEPEFVWTPPPGWSKPEPGWRPPVGWKPDPRWPRAPKDWRFYQPDPAPITHPVDKEEFAVTKEWYERVRSLASRWELFKTLNNSERSLRKINWGHAYFTEVTAAQVERNTVLLPADLAGVDLHQCYLELVDTMEALTSSLIALFQQDTMPDYDDEMQPVITLLDLAHLQAKTYMEKAEKHIIAEAKLDLKHAEEIWRERVARLKAASPRRPSTRTRSTIPAALRTPPSQVRRRRRAIRLGRKQSIWPPTSSGPSATPLHVSRQTATTPDSTWSAPRSQLR